jgi:hypothetical protein
VHAANELPSSRHSNVAPDGPVNENDTFVELLGFGGVLVNVGAASGGAATEMATANAAATRTPSTTRSLVLAVLAVLPIFILVS